METLDVVRMLAALSALGIAAYFALRRIVFLVRLLRKARPMPARWGNWGAKLRFQLTHVLAQQKILKWSGSGILHVFMFWGFVVLQTQTVEAVGDVFDPHFHIPFFGPGLLRTEVLGFLQDLFTILVLVAVVGFAVIRVVQSPRTLGRSSRFAGSDLPQGWYVLLAEFGLLYTVLMLRGARYAEATLPYAEGAFLSRLVGRQLADLAPVSLELIATVYLVAHVAVLSGFIVFTLHSKHLHVFSFVPSVAFSRLPKALGKLEADIIDMEAMSEDDVLGVGSLEHFGFKRMLDMYSCTECGRCQSQCPAWNTGKPLSPKLLIMDLRDHLYATGPYLLDENLAEEHKDLDLLNMMLVGDRPGQVAHQHHVEQVEVFVLLGQVLIEQVGTRGVQVVAQVHDQQLRRQRLAGVPGRALRLAAAALRAGVHVQHALEAEVLQRPDAQDVVLRHGLHVDDVGLELAQGLGQPAERHARHDREDVQVLGVQREHDEARQHGDVRNQVHRGDQLQADRG